MVSTVTVGPSPDSLQGMVRNAPVVVRGTVLNTLQPRLDRQIVQRRSILEVNEVLKASDSLAQGARIVVQQVGGTLTIDDREFVTAYTSTPLAAGQEVILFLVPAGEQSFALLWGDDGRFKVDERSRTVAIPTRLRKDVSNQSQAPASALIDAIRLANKAQ